MIWIIFGVFAVISYLVQSNLKSKFKQYSRVPIASGMTGAQVAEKMLRDNGIYDVRVTSVPGQLTDHYNPTDKTVNLSEGVYGSCSVAAAAVAAHECMILVNAMPGILLGGIVLFALTTLFSFITLPVEIDASRRATQWLAGAGITSRENYPMAVSALRSAAYTYVVAALGSLATLIYYALIYSNNRD